MSACAAFWSFSFCASVASLEGVARRPLPLNLSFMGLSIFLSRPGYASCSECARDLRSRGVGGRHEHFAINTTRTRTETRGSHLNHGQDTRKRGSGCGSPWNRIHPQAIMGRRPPGFFWLLLPLAS